MSALDAIKQWAEAWGTGDTAAVAATYADDVVYQHAMVPEPLHGREAVHEFISGMGAAFSDIDVTVDRAVVDGQEVAAEVSHRARHTGDLPTPMGPIPATGKTVVLVAAHFFRVDGDGLIAEEHMYADPGAMLAQLG